MKLIALTLPGSGSGGATSSVDVPAPSNIPAGLTKGFSDSGASFIQFATNSVFTFGAIVATIMIIYSGIQMITSNGDPGRVAAARSRLMYAVFGLVLMIGAYFVVIAILKLAGQNVDFFFKK